MGDVISKKTDNYVFENRVLIHGYFSNVLLQKSKENEWNLLSILEDQKHRTRL